MTNTISNPVRTNLIQVGSGLKSKLGRLPTFLDCAHAGISIKNIKYHFGSFANYHQVIDQYKPPAATPVLPVKVDPKASVELDKIDDARMALVNECIKHIQSNNRFPAYTDFAASDIRSTIRHHFGNFDKFADYIRNNYSDEIEDYLFDHNDMLSDKAKQNLADAVNRNNSSKRFIVTSATSGKDVFEPFYQSIKNYCTINDAQLLIMPITETAAIKDWSFDPRIRNEIFVTEKVKLNDNLFIVPYLVTAKTVRPTSGLGRAVQEDGSIIFGSPKQELEFISTSTGNPDCPRASMSTGSLTEGTYKGTEMFMSKSNFMAEVDHLLGAIVVDVVDDKEFHFRQIQSDRDGGFTDLGEYYNAKTASGADIEERELHMIAGDWHTGWESPSVLVATERMFDELPITDVYAHDFFDGHSISHHDIGNPMKTSRKAVDGRNDLRKEIEMGAHRINWFLDRIAGNLIMLTGNHDEFLPRYLESGRYLNDPVNKRYAMPLAILQHDGENVLKAAYEQTGIIKEPNRIIWLGRDESYKIASVQLGDHGDKGFNGSKGSLLSAERAHGNCVIGHTHSAAILHGVYRVGTSTVLRMDYNVGASNWTQTHCLLDAKSGARQLINIINDNYRG